MLYLRQLEQAKGLTYSPAALLTGQDIGMHWIGGWLVPIASLVAYGRENSVDPARN